MKTIKNRFNGKILEVFESSPYDDGTHLPSNNHCFARESGSKSYSFFRGSYCLKSDIDFISKC